MSRPGTCAAPTCEGPALSLSWAAILCLRTPISIQPNSAGVAMILVTCANGRLGTAIIKALLKDEDCPPLRIAARDITKINKSLAARCTLLKEIGRAHV